MASVAQRAFETISLANLMLRRDHKGKVRVRGWVAGPLRFFQLAISLWNQIRTTHQLLEKASYIHHLEPLDGQGVTPVKYILGVLEVSNIKLHSWEF